MDTRITTEEVLQAIKDSGLREFSSQDIALQINADEYQVRAAIGWLLHNKFLKKYRTIKRYTKETHHPYWATTYLVEDRWGPPDLAMLNRVFLGVVQ